MCVYDKVECDKWSVTKWSVRGGGAEAEGWDTEPKKEPHTKMWENLYILHIIRPYQHCQKHETRPSVQQGVLGEEFSQRHSQ